MIQERRVLEFTINEHYEHQNWLELDKGSKFCAVCVVPEERKVIGVFRPLKELANDMGLDTEQIGFPANIIYTPESEGEESLYLSYKRPLAHWFLKMPWLEFKLTIDGKTYTFKERR
ncbi:MAG TPA: hypothetical protein PKI14_13780 [Fervidobacterium sp.]|nr:hypothetical protein [Fervidobacterium sp.]